MRRCSLSTAVLLALAVGPLSGCASTGGASPFASRAAKIDAQYDIARLAESENQYDRAKEMYEGILKKEPKNADVCHRLGIIHARQTKYEAAKRYLNEAHRLRPSDAEILNDLGYVCFLTEELGEAEIALQEAMKIDPGNRRATNNMALVVGTQGRMDESFRLFRQVNREAEAHANIAYLHAQQGDGTKAMQHYSQALSLDPNLKSAGNAMVEIARMQQKLDHDRAQLARATQTTPDVQQVAAAKPVAGTMPQLGQVVAQAQVAREPATAIPVSTAPQVYQPIPVPQMAVVQQAPVAPLATTSATQHRTTSVPPVSNPFVEDTPVATPVVAHAATSDTKLPEASPIEEVVTPRTTPAINVRDITAVDYVALCPHASPQVKALLAGMNSNDVSQMKPALHKLGELNEKAASAEPAIRAAVQHDEIYVRLHAALALWRIKQVGADVVPVFISGLQDSDAGVRSFAATAIAMGPKDDAFVAPLTAALGDTNAFVRMHAAETLYHYEGQENLAIEVIVSHLSDKEANVRWLATFILGEILPESDLAVQSLTKSLQDRDNRIRASAAFALGGLGEQAKPAIPELKKLTTDAQPEVRKAAEEAVRDIEQSTAQASIK